jgi:predicted AlkP superfamily phosphohydrolase/phosphomutase
MIAARAQTILHLMQTEKWDVLMAVFIATDRVQHYFWPRDLLDIDAPDWQPIRQVYRQIDEFFGKALSLVDEDTNLLVVSDHGFGPTLPAKRYLQQLFAELGLLRMKRSGGGNVKGRTLKSLLKSGRKILPYALQTRLARALPALHLQAVNAHGKATMDWPATKVFTSASGGRVWINLKGRSEEGSVSIDDYEALRQQVCEILLKITDSATGRSAIRAVHKREDLYHGEFLEKAPDLVLEWDYEVFSQGLVYQDGEHSIVVKPEKGNQRGNHWSGNHRPLGIFIACGKHIKQGATLTGANIYDIAPTLLYLQDVAISRDSDGKVLTEIFADERLTAQPLRWREEASLSTQPPAKPINEEEARQIEERLRGLGYIE